MVPADPKLLRKLGLKPGFRCWSNRSLADLLGPLPDDIEHSLEAPLDLQLLFHTEIAALEEGLRAAKQRMHPKAMVWTAWPKKASKVATELDRETVRAIGLATGLVDVKVCSIDSTWSGLKWVWRVADRP